MDQTARDEILARLRAAPRGEPVARPELPPLSELAWDRETMIAKFGENLALQTGILHRASDYRQAADRLSEIARQESWRMVVASTDEVIRPLDPAGWGEKNGVEVRTARDFPDREAYQDALFGRADAGITGVECALAETGTLVLAHDREQPRLLSLAPPAHLAVVPLERLFVDYETAIERVFRGDRPPPSQLTFISGPSMSADIQAISFRGMHGPGRLFVILVG